MTRDELLATFAGFPARLADAIHDAAGAPTPPGEWGAAENVRHLIAVERLVWQVRFVEVLTLDRPALELEGAGPGARLG